jgi:integrin beta 3
MFPPPDVPSLISQKVAEHAHESLPAIIEELRRQMPQPKDGKDGKDGVDGLPGPVGRDGADGNAGKDGVDGKDGADGREGPAGNDGKDGRDGVDGHDGKDGIPGRDGEPGKDGRSVELSEVEAFTEKVIDSHVSRWALDFERRAHEQFQRAIDRMPTPKDGRDGFSIDDLSITDDGHGNITFTFKRGELEKVYPVRLPCFEYLGVYQDGNKYLRGHGVSFGGSLWLALVDSPEGKPAEGSKDWQLAVKRGRDGNDFREGDPKPNGKGIVRLK